MGVGSVFPLSSFGPQKIWAVMQLAESKRYPSPDWSQGCSKARSRRIHQQGKQAGSKWL